MELKYLFFAETERKRFRHATFSPAVSVMGEAAESIWRRVNFAIVESSLRFTTIVHGSFMFSFKKSPFTLEFQMLRGQNVSHLLATSFKILVANTQSLVTLATSESQFRTLCFMYAICISELTAKLQRVIIAFTNMLHCSMDFV